MDEQVPAKEFKATDYDENGNIKLPPPVPTPPKPKRLTVADLAKRFDELEKDIDATVFESLSALDARLEKLETGSLSDRADVATDIAARLDNQNAAIGALVDTLGTYGEGIADWGSRMEECEDSITSLQTANADIQESAKHTELEFAEPPQPTAGSPARAGDIGSLRQTYPPVQTAGGQIQKSDIKAVASVCQTMTDVLLICRLLKAEQSIPDEDRTSLLTAACRAAGVPLSPGLQIRAGVRNVEA